MNTQEFMKYYVFFFFKYLKILIPRKPNLFDSSKCHSIELFFQINIVPTIYFLKFKILNSYIEKKFLIRKNVFQTNIFFYYLTDGFKNISTFRHYAFSKTYFPMQSPFWFFWIPSDVKSIEICLSAVVIDLEFNCKKQKIHKLCNNLRSEVEFFPFGGQYRFSREH